MGLIRGCQREHGHARREPALGGEDDTYKEVDYQLATIRGRAGGRVTTL